MSCNPETCHICRHSKIVDRIKRAIRQTKGRKVNKTLNIAMDMINELGMENEDQSYTIAFKKCKFCGQSEYDWMEKKNDSRRKI